MSTFLDGALVFIVVIVGLVVFDAYVGRRREKRLRSETASSLQDVRDHSDAQIQETRKRTDAYQIRICALMQEHNSLLREILAKVGARGDAP